LEVGRRKAEAMLILFRVQLFNEKNPPKRGATHHLKLGRANSRSLKKTM
jgi:hypothetical protein